MSNILLMEDERPDFEDSLLLSLVLRAGLAVNWTPFVSGNSPDITDAILSPVMYYVGNIVKEAFHNVTGSLPKP